MSIYKGNDLIANSEFNIDLTPDTVPTKSSPSAVMSGGVYNALLTKEDTTNKTTVVDASSTNDQYPSAKAVYDAIEDLDPVNVEYARDLYTPDWPQAVPIPQMDLFNGYAAPKRGIFVGSTIPQTTDVAGYNGHIRLNGIVIGYGYILNEDVRAAVINIPVSPGDVIKSDVIMVRDGFYTIYFVPYKRQ